MNQTNQDMNAGMAMSTNMGATKKEGKGMMIGMICCSILAIAGIGFGIYEMTQANQSKQQISDLKVEIKNSDGSTTTLETDKIEVKEDTKTVIVPEVPAALSTYSSIQDNYLYLFDWGVKVKLSSETGNVTGILWDNIRGSYGIYGGDDVEPYNPSVSPLSLKRSKKTDVAPQALQYDKVVYEDDEYYYIASEPNGMPTSQQAAWDFIRNNDLLNSENWSKI